MESPPRANHLVSGIDTHFPVHGHPRRASASVASWRSSGYTPGVSYDLIWEGSVNVTASYPTRKAALDALRETYAEHGRDFIAEVLLARTDRRGTYHVVAEGAALAELVELELERHTKERTVA